MKPQYDAHSRVGVLQGAKRVLLTNGNKQNHYQHCALDQTTVYGGLEWKMLDASKSLALGHAPPSCSCQLSGTPRGGSRVALEWTKLISLDARFST